ncbi:hypothetical protein OOK58_04685 [Streptomyces sp. NBC_01728]|uniref:hypothetical protein n=1 Tax=unclassified Streptomyces TaxID=2593676 RepID=UPI002254A4EA|nr:MULTISPECIES: hypothetical protein [unclassified Streptomyces]MCX4461901.1 hypothetical protein [Streptomyces sp. NBC_01719]MCX4490809.1 hypothetical protein [Streptomyces sp. NBC_01728]MCX4594622.1 hypothetical protein [Streptomyces sp. NBC_01549]
MVVDAGQHLALAPVSEVDPADQVQLPPVHRRRTLPSLVLAGVPLFLQNDQAVTGE